MGFLKAMATVGGWTLISRLLGFLRDILIAGYLGTGATADAWVVAFRLPNLFRRLLGEGAFNAAFVPLFAGRLEQQGKPVATRFAEEALSLLVTVALVLTALALFAMEWVMTVIAPGFLADPAKFAEATGMARIAFPYLLFMALAALLSGVLNSLRRFAAAAAAPVLLNLFLILGLLAVLPLTGQPGQVLVWSVVAAGAAQFLLLIVAAARAGYPLRLRRPRLTPGMRRLLVLMVPGLISAGALQLNLFVGTMIATLQPGAASLLYYADRVYQLPLGLIGIAVSVVLLPEIARRLKGDGEAAAARSLAQGLEFALFLTIPAAVALVILAEPIATVLFQRGAFDAAASQATGLAILAYAVGLPAYVAIKVYQPAFYAREDMTTPLRAALWSVAANIALSLLLFFALRDQGLGHLGLAAATTLAALVNVAYLWIALARRGLLALPAAQRRRLWRQGLAAAGMGAGLLAALGPLESDLAGGEVERAAALALLVLGGLLVYASLALALGALPLTQVKAAWQRLRQRSQKAKTDPTTKED
ncbi:MAG: murein biosynthesis integral membrane protein MurJ [Rhodospirillales bacterium]